MCGNVLVAVITVAVPQRSTILQPFASRKNADERSMPFARGQLGQIWRRVDSEDSHAVALEAARAECRRCSQCR